MKNLLERTFQLESNNTSIKQEFLAGFTTFITMAYIIFVNPQMMSASGMDLGASFVGTCIAAAIACFAMGFYSNWPVGLAPGMGLNAFFTYTVVGEMGYSWEVALGAVFLAGQIYEFTEFYHKGFVLSSNIFSSTFYVLTGFHGLHVFIGVVLLIALWSIGQRQNGLSLDGGMNLEFVALYWHFVDIVWIVLFTVVYLI